VIIPVLPEGGVSRKNDQGLAQFFSGDDSSNTGVSD
jgi:hypothetical protein